jgi:hypothetical protein
MGTIARMTRQGKLFSSRGCSQTRATRVEFYADQNRVCAEIILRDRVRYAGLPVVWAEAVLQGTAEHCRDWGFVA